MKVLLSIKPEHAAKIFSGEKKYEFRRVIFKNTAGTKVVVYGSSPPLQKVIGEEFFFCYFTNKAQGYTIQIKRTRNIVNRCASGKI